MSNLEYQNTADDSTKQDQSFHSNLVQGTTGIDRYWTSRQVNACRQLTI